MAMRATSKAGLTIEEFLRLPEMKPYPELIGGEIHQKVAPSGLHQLIEQRLLTLFSEMPGIAATELTTVFADGGDERVLVPDFSYYHDRSRFSLGEQRNPPDLAVEIRSGGQSMAVLREKAKYYLAHGVEEAWLVDPYDELVEVWRGETPSARRPGEIVAFGGLNIAVAALIGVEIEDEPPGS